MSDTWPTFETKEKNKMIRYAQSKKLPQTTCIDMSNLDEGGFFFMAENDVYFASTVFVSSQFLTVSSLLSI